MGTLQLEFKRGQHATDYSENCYSFCYGFYGLIRTSLDASGKFSEALQKVQFSQELSDFRSSQSKAIQDIINIANDYIKHPLDNGTSKVTWYEPGGLDNSGNVSINEWSTANDDHFKILEINPIRDARTVHKYLETLAEIHMETIKISGLQSPVDK